MNHYPRHIGDYLRDTSHLSLLEHGVYGRILDVYYLNDGPIPGDIPGLCRKLGARSVDERAAVEAVVTEFFTRTEDGSLSSKRFQAVIEKYRDFGKAQRERAMKRYTKSADGMPTAGQMLPAAGDSVPAACQPDGMPTNNHKPETNNHKPRTKIKSRPLVPPPGDVVYPPGLDTDEFRAVWAEFQQHRVEIKKPMTPTAIRNGLLRAADLGIAKAIPALRAAMVAGYSQFYEQQDKLNKSIHEHRSEKRSREFTEQLQVPDFV